MLFTDSNPPMSALVPKVCPNLSAYRVAEYQLERIQKRAPEPKKGQPRVVTVDEQSQLDVMDRLWARLTDAQKRLLGRESACLPS